MAAGAEGRSGRASAAGEAAALRCTHGVVAVAARVRERGREGRLQRQVVDVLEHERVRVHVDELLELRHVEDPEGGGGDGGGQSEVAR